MAEGGNKFEAFYRVWFSFLLRLDIGHGDRCCKTIDGVPCTFRCTRCTFRRHA